MNWQESVEQNLLILSKGYVSQKDIAKLLGCSDSKISNMFNPKKRSPDEVPKIKRYPWGFSTEEVIKYFNLEDFVKRMEREAKIVKKASPS